MTERLAPWFQIYSRALAEIEDAKDHELLTRHRVGKNVALEAGEFDLAAKHRDQERQAERRMTDRKRRSEGN